MNSDSELAAAFNSLVAQPKQEIEYRAYYNEHGWVTHMSSSGSSPGNYVLISKELYDRAIVNDLRVVSGVCKRIDLSTILNLQLKKSATGFRVVKNHPAIVLRDNEAYTEIEFYARTY